MAPTNFWPALFVGLSSLFIYITKSKNPQHAGVFGFIFSMGYFSFGLYWVGNALLVEDNPYWWAWPLAITGLPLILSLFTALACIAHKKLCLSENKLLHYLSFCIFISIAEYLRGHLFTGFPWNLYGYTWIDVLPIAQLASLSDIYLLTYFTIFWACAPALILSYKNQKIYAYTYTALLFFSLAISYGWGQLRISNIVDHNSPHSFVIVQPNIKQSEKWKPENRTNNFLSLIKLSRFNDQQIDESSQSIYILWPETSISQDLLNAPWVVDTIRSMLNSYPMDAHLVAGALRFKDGHYYNSVIIMNNSGQITDIYDKSHLVPFGEYMPMDEILNISPIVGFSGFEFGKGPTVMTAQSGLKLAPLICYEVIFPKSLVKKQSYDVIINVTNDGWYGLSTGPYQHLVQSQFRAIESGKPLMRVANTGISAAINKDGSISKFMPLQTSGMFIVN